MFLVFSYFAAILFCQRKMFLILEHQYEGDKRVSFIFLFLPWGCAASMWIYEHKECVRIYAKCKGAMRNGYLVTMVSSVWAVGSGPAEMFCCYSHWSDARWSVTEWYGGPDNNWFCTGRDFLEEACSGKNSWPVTIGLLRSYCVQELHMLYHPCFVDEIVKLREVK